MSLLQGLIENARNTALIKSLQAGFQQYGQNRQQGIPLMQGSKYGTGTSSSVINALKMGKASAIDANYGTRISEQGGSGGGGGGGGGGADPYPGDDKYTTRYSSSSDSGGGGDGGDGGSGKSEAQIAKERYEAAKNAIIGRLNMMKQEAERLRGQAKSAYDFGTGEIAKNYGQLKQLSAEKLQQALEALGLQDTQVQNMYGRVAGNARRAMESALTRNRMLSRAMGTLGSSFYSDSQGDTTNQGMNTLNDTAIEEAAKRNAIGTQKSATSTEFAQNDVAIGAEEAQLKQAALDKYNDEIAQADMLQKNYNIDSEAAIAEANANLDSALNQIREYTLQNQGYSGKGYSTTGNTYSNLSSSLPKYDAIAPIKSTLDNQENYSGAEKFIANASNVARNGNTNPMDSSGGQSNSLLDTIKFKAKNKKEDPNQYFLNRAYA